MRIEFNIGANLFSNGSNLEIVDLKNAVVGIFIVVGTSDIESSTIVPGVRVENSNLEVIEFVLVVNEIESTSIVSFVVVEEDILQVQVASIAINTTTEVSSVIEMLRVEDLNVVVNSSVGTTSMSSKAVLDGVDLEPRFNDSVFNVDGSSHVVLRNFSARVEHKKLRKINEILTISAVDKVVEDIEINAL